MKKFILFLFGAISTFILNSQIYNLTDEKISGKVKSLIESEYFASELFGEISKDSLRIKSIYNFDNSGKVVEYSIYESNGKIMYRYTFLYEDGNRINEKQYSAKGELVVERKNIFDVKNRILEENIYYYLAKDSVKYKFEYNDLNKISRQYIYKPNGSIKDEWVFNYDAHGNRIETIYNGYITTSFKYDGKRNLIETSSFNGKVESYKYSSFDINGNWQQQTIFKNTIPIKIVSREYKYY